MTDYNEENQWRKEEESSREAFEPENDTPDKEAADASQSDDQQAEDVRWEQTRQDNWQNAPDWQPQGGWNQPQNGYSGQGSWGGQGQGPYPPRYYSGQQNYQGGWRNQNGQWNGQPAQQPYQWNFDQMHASARGENTPGKQNPHPVKKKNKGLRVFLAILCAIALVVVSGFGVYGMYVALTGDTLQAPSGPQDIGGALPPSASNSVPDLSTSDKPLVSAGGNSDGTMTNQQIFKKCSPSVVGVVGYMNSTTVFAGQASEGSGIIMTEDGYILTNAHVVSDPAISYVEVVLPDGENHRATIVGLDTQTDIAVLKVEATGLEYAEFGNSDQLEVGERVIAIGNPGGLRFASTLTVGYVSALNRTITAGDAGYSMECIQTDAAINPGNSGGALINEFGQVVGVNSAKYNDSSFEGMGFAIPINTALPIAQDLIKNGKVTGRAMLGITATVVSPSVAEYSGIPLGLQIMEVKPGTDIATKDVRVNDIITHINGSPIYSFDATASILNDYNPGDTVTITVFRRDSRGKDTTFNLDIVLTGS